MKLLIQLRTMYKIAQFLQSLRNNLLYKQEHRNVVQCYTGITQIVIFADKLFKRIVRNIMKVEMKLSLQMERFSIEMKRKQDFANFQFERAIKRDDDTYDKGQSEDWFNRLVSLPSKIFSRARHHAGLSILDEEN